MLRRILLITVSAIAVLLGPTTTIMALATDEWLRIPSDNTYYGLRGDLCGSDGGQCNHGNSSRQLQTGGTLIFVGLLISMADCSIVLHVLVWPFRYRHTEAYQTLTYALVLISAFLQLACLLLLYILTVTIRHQNQDAEFAQSFWCQVFSVVITVTALPLTYITFASYAEQDYQMIE